MTIQNFDSCGGGGEWGSDGRITANKATVEVGRAEKGPNVVDRVGGSDDLVRIKSPDIVCRRQRVLESCGSERDGIDEICVLLGICK
jgi:hypothetical protein